MLKAGDAAPNFDLMDDHRRSIRLADFQGRTLVIEFSRYVGCPVCSLRLQELARLAPELDKRGTGLVVFLQSSRAKIQEYTRERPLPYPIVPDPDRAYYGLYGVEPGGWGAVLNVATIAGGIRAWRAGHKHGAFEGKETQTPADFVVGPDGRVLHAHYGKHAADVMTPEAILAALPR